MIELWLSTSFRTAIEETINTFMANSYAIPLFGQKSSPQHINGHFRYLNWKDCTIFFTIFWSISPYRSPKNRAFYTEYIYRWYRPPTSWVPPTQNLGRQVNVIETLEKVIDVPVVKQVEVPQALGLCGWGMGNDFMGR